MDSETAMAAARLLERADHLRNLALQMRSRGIGIELERIARRYEADAAELELNGMNDRTNGTA